MQAYLDTIDCERPSYNEIAHNKLDPKYNPNFGNTKEFIANMSASRKKNATIVSIGFWALDFVSYSDWRQSTHAGKTFPEFVSMACIEHNVVYRYRPIMFKECLASAHIRTALAEALGEACKPQLFETGKKKAGKKQKSASRRFFYPDKLACEPPSKVTIDVVQLKQTRERVLKFESLNTEAAALLRKIENFKGSSAAPNSKEIDKGVSKAITRLRDVRYLSRLFPFTLP